MRRPKVRRCAGVVSSQGELASIVGGDREATAVVEQLRRHADLLGVPGPVTSRIATAFRLMEVAEEEIERASLPEGPRGPMGKRAFGALYPGDLVEYGEDLYRSHCRTLLARLLRGEDLAPATDAELLAVLSRTSQEAPLTQGGAAAMARLFARVYPGRCDPDIADLDREAWDGQVFDILLDMRRRYRRER